MAASALEARLAALFTLAEAAFAGTAQRNGATSVTVPAGGLLIQRDGEPGEPEILLSPLSYHFDHQVEWEILFQKAGGAEDAADAQITALGTAIAADRTLGGLCDWVEAMRTRAYDVPIDDDRALPVRVDIVTVTLSYGTANPLT